MGNAQTTGPGQDAGVRVDSTPAWWGGASSPGGQGSAGVSGACLTNHAPGGGVPAWGSPSGGGTGTKPVWGGRPSAPSTQPSGQPGGQPGDAAGQRSRLGVQVAGNGQAAGQPGQAPGQGQAPGPGGQDGPMPGTEPQQPPRRRRTLREWWWSPIHQSPGPMPAWLGRLVLATRSAGAGEAAEAAGESGASATSPASGPAVGAVVPQALPRTLGDLVGSPLKAARQAAAARVASVLRGGGAR